MCRRAPTLSSYATALAIGLSVPIGSPSATAVFSRQPTPDSALREMLEACFRGGDSKEGSQACTAIARSVNGDVDRIAAELPNARLWTDQPERGTWAFKLPSGELIDVQFRLPQAYRPNQAFPLIVVMPPLGNSTQYALDAAITSVGPPGADHAWVMPAAAVGGSFYQPIAAAADLPALLREVRRRIHLDRQRVYLLGSGDAGDAAWIAAIMHPFEFAGVIVIDAYPRILYPRQACTLLLPNLHDLPVLASWYAPETSDHSCNFPIADFNRAIVDFAKRTSLPITGFELTSDRASPNPFSEKGNELRGLLSARRPAPPAGIRHWFRYPAQGDCGWLRVTEFAGDIWQEDQLSIALHPTTDRDRFITRTIAEKLALLSGRIEGQNIVIQTRHCAAVELRLSPRQVDFRKAITIFCNGLKRFEGLISPSITDLLESASDDWDFQHPVFARKNFLIRTDSPFDVP